MTMRFDLKFFWGILKNQNSRDASLTALFSPKDLALISLLKEVKPSPDCNDKTSNILKLVSL